MKDTLMRYATPFITGLFLVSLVSGIALFFHIGPSAFHGMHEWLSMVLILPFVLHVWRNWRAMLNYTRGKPLAIALVASLAASAVFFLPMGGAGGGRPPHFALAQMMMEGSAADVAPVLGTTPEALTAALADAGFAVTDADAKLSEMATASGKSVMDLAGLLVAQGQAAAR
ncbi:DUF4405 domain-containing protein [Phaeovulum vinaykumarii]|uniref:DUF4405 domain-containing protein n=1 Tax=Phaeovulum vinaykumarii TaxID=407234 RepID=A0A1N7M890_9RHOB|nr:DUF4405 domain-containing protein [Phaeovulum vinaykumarii]SIS82199.1 hypothetical protein SAMN05421795_10637 [Phaeovulum vinaykumarii]SOC11138.1 hypothetical protein SAMN05878426_106153 [Phaeovulum vinaykumarii]